MEIKEYRTLSTSQKEEICALWNQEYPASLAYSEVAGFEKYLAGLGSPRHLLLEEEGRVVGWYADFIREEEKWFAMIFDHRIQGKGWGRRVLQRVKDEGEVLNGWVIDNEEMDKLDGQKYRSPLGFYQKCGFEVVSDVRLEIPVLSAVKIIFPPRNSSQPE